MIAPALGSWGGLSNCSLPGEGMQHTHFCTRAESQMCTFLSQATYDTATKPHILVFFSHHSQAKLLPLCSFLDLHCHVTLPLTPSFISSLSPSLKHIQGALWNFYFVINKLLCSLSLLTNNLFVFVAALLSPENLVPLQLVQETHIPQGQETFLFLSSLVPLQDPTQDVYSSETNILKAATAVLLKILV